MNPETSHGLISLPGRPRLWMEQDEGAVAPPKLMVIGMRGRFRNTSPRNILASTSRLFGFVTALTTILIGTIANRTASFLTSIETSLLSWKSNSGILFAPGSKLGLYTSLWCEEFLGRIGTTQLVKSPPTTTPQSPFPSRSIIYLNCLRLSPNGSVSTLFGREN